MISTANQNYILKKLSQGLTICEHPYLELANELAIDENDVIAFINESLSQSKIKRVGFVVNHHKVGYSSNAMVVWDVPDNKVDEVGTLLGEQEKVTLCYQRPRRLPGWPYNLFTMVHGKDRAEVLAQIEQIVVNNRLEKYSRDILFSSKKFKQTGARYDK